MKKNILKLLILPAVLLNACSNTRTVTGGSDDQQIGISFVQINDVYEIAPLDGGRSGGMARVAAIKKNELNNNPNTFLLIAGDFLSPSVYNSLRYDGNRIRGRQMVEVMNTAGVDLAVFGNHEFDITEQELQSRINESAFQWVSTNTFQKKGTGIAPFFKNRPAGEEPFPETYIMRLKDTDGTTANIGYIGITLPFNKAGYVSYTDAFTAAENAYNKLKDSCDAVIAVTHQSMEDDIKLARQLPGLTLIIGGHEHERHYAKIGNVYITKADANARSVYMIRLKINKKRHTVKVDASIMDVNGSISPDPATDSVVKKWTTIANNSYASLGFDATKVVLNSGEPLDGREAYIRTQQTNFTRLITAAMEKASSAADVVIINSGSIRVDDILQMPVTQYDIIRSLPFGGSILEVDMKGSLLTKILNAGKNNVGSGGFLQYSQELANDNATGQWALKGTPIDPGKVYKVALTDFLMTGGEANLGFLTKDNPDIIKVYPVYSDMNDPRSDIRRAIIRYMETISR
jgi:5'-nucleotidase